MALSLRRTSRGVQDKVLAQTSNVIVIGVVVTPVCVHFLMAATGQHGHLGSLLGQILLLTLVPFAVGMLQRPVVWRRVDANKRWVN